MAVIDASNILPVLAASTVMLVFILKIYLTLRTKFPVKVNCWFCNSNTKVPYINHNSWYCPHCEQYNGFTKDGGYNRPMVEQYNSEFNHRTWNTKVKPVVKQRNSLCRVCNINQELKVAQLAQFTPFDPNNFDYEVEQYSNKLEKAYRLCPQCEVKLKETLERKRYLFKGLNVEDAQKIISTAIRTVQKGNKICTVSTGIVSGCLFLSGVNYFITNSWLYVYLQQTAEEILLAVNIPEFLMYSRDSGVISTLISWLSAQTDWINSKLAASEVSVSSVLTGIGTLLQCVDCMQQRNISAMLNLTSWSILFGLSLSPVLKQTAVLIKAVEVTSKPDLYPIVQPISYTTDSGKNGSSYLMVQYFRNYIMRPVGSLSATSTADSLSSSLFCNAANEANSLVPPPYSSAPDNVDQVHLNTAPFDQGGGNGSHNRLKLYMPLSRGRHWLSRSAPTTPSSRLTPANAFPTGESSPLLQPDQDTVF